MIVRNYNYTEAVKCMNDDHNHMHPHKKHIMPVGPANNEIWYTTNDGLPYDMVGTEDDPGTQLMIQLFLKEYTQLDFPVISPISNIYNKDLQCFVMTFENDVTYTGFDVNTQEVIPIGPVFGVPDILAEELIFSNITSITLPDCVEQIGSMSFIMNLTSVLTIPKNVNLIQEDAIVLFGIDSFVYKGTLSEWEQIYIDDYSLQSEINPVVHCIDGDTLYYDFCTYSEDGKTLISCNGRAYGLIIVKDGVETIGDNAFDGCYRVTSIVLPNSVKTIGDKAFFMCLINDINLSEGLTLIGNSAFAGCYNIIHLDLPSTITDIGYGAFANCTNLISLVIPEGITTISNGMCSECNNMEYITLPSTILSIDNFAFFHCYKLKEIVLPVYVSSIGRLTFDSCESLIGFTSLNPVPPTLQWDSLYDMANCPIYVPSSSVEDYKTGLYWNLREAYIQPISD